MRYVRDVCYVWSGKYQVHGVENMNKMHRSENMNRMHGEENMDVTYG